MDNYTTGRKKAWPALDYEGMERVIEAVMQDARNGDKDAREWLLEYERIRTRGHKTGNDKVLQDKVMQVVRDNLGDPAYHAYNQQQQTQQDDAQ